MHKTYLNWEQIHCLQNVAILNWTKRNAGRGSVVRVWCMKQEAWPTYWFHYLDSSPLFEPASSLAKQFNNTCQLLKCQGFVLTVNSLTGVTRTTYQLLLTSWQWGGCYRFSRDYLNKRKGWPGDWTEVVYVGDDACKRTHWQARGEQGLLLSVSGTRG